MIGFVISGIKNDISEEEKRLDRVILLYDPETDVWAARRRAVGDWPV